MAPPADSDHSVRWSQVFRRSRAIPGVFVVSRPYEDAVAGLVAALPVPGISAGGMYEPVVEGWAFLDGGMHHIDSDGYGMWTLHSAWRVIGSKSLVALCRLLALAPPERLMGEPLPLDSDALVAELMATTIQNPELMSRAELIAAAATGDDLRGVMVKLNSHVQ